MLELSFRSLPAINNLRGGEGGRGESWLRCLVVHKAFINSSAFQRGGWEMKKFIAFRFTDVAVFFSLF